jgi:kinesin family member 2/24
MPKLEFVGRCMATPNVTEDHAAVVYSKLWRMHISKKRFEEQSTSAVDTETAEIPFKDRLRPGMIVRLRQPDTQKAAQELVLIMSPDQPSSTDSSEHCNDHEKPSAYICANIEPAEFQNAYSINIWKQKAVLKADMETEVILEYDKASRYYFLGM